MSAIDIQAKIDKTHKKIVTEKLSHSLKCARSSQAGPGQAHKYARVSKPKSYIYRHTHQLTHTHRGRQASNKSNGNSQGSYITTPCCSFRQRRHRLFQAAATSTNSSPFLNPPPPCSLATAPPHAPRIWHASSWTTPLCTLLHTFGRRRRRRCRCLCLCLRPRLCCCCCFCCRHSFVCILG